LILDSLSELAASGVRVRLRLLGAPGRESPAGASWLEGARSRNLTGMLSFSGALPAQALSNELAACDVLLFADGAGPTSRKGTLAASLASGRAVVAIDGPQSWPELVSAEAVRLADASPRGLAAAISALLGDAHERVALGGRGRAFAELHMGVDRTAKAVWTLLGGALGPTGAPAPRDSPSVPSG
jgi:hypothetical protein